MRRLGRYVTRVIGGRSGVGLVGFSQDTGLGVATRDFAAHLPFTRWLVLAHPHLGVNDDVLDKRCTVGGRTMPGAAVDEWLKGLRTVFAIQAGYAPQLWQRAKRAGLLTVLMPNWERFAPHHPDVQAIDRFVAPTRACADFLAQAGLGGQTVYIPHAVDVVRFAFRRRERAETFLHIAGWDRRDRKGTSLVLEAARLCPEVPFVIRSLSPPLLPIPPNVRWLGHLVDQTRLYDDGDVAIQPSRYEGVGLPVLEAQASGLPVLVPDAPPMNEHPPDRRLLFAASPIVGNNVGQPFPACVPDVHSLVEAIRRLHRQSIADLSEASRAKMEERSWDRLRPAYLEALDFEFDPRTGTTPFADPPAMTPP
jgi:glycosyltransferase involved in cell wall biosynthesis